jgi:multicomponent Na+:H+ antiporter subunit C
MSIPLLYALTGVVLWGISLCGLIGLRHLLRKLLALNLMGSATFLVLVGLAQHHNGPDPVPQALVLTGIVVAAWGGADPALLPSDRAHRAGT